jgi:hypothetical protein
LGYKKLALTEVAGSHDLSEALHGKNRQMEGLTVTVDFVAIMLREPSF